MKTLQEIKDCLLASDARAVLTHTEAYLNTSGIDASTLAEAYYLRGNAYRQQGEWGSAMNCYLKATDLNPSSPAAEAYRTAQQILDFYNKDFYNP